MKILVLLKKTKAWEGLPSMLNPADLNALEAALQIKDAQGAEVVVLSMGPADSEQVLREALGLGANQAVLLSDEALTGSDTLATSRALAAAIRHLGEFDLILAGAASLDGFTGQIGPKVAGLLGLPVLTEATGLTVAEGKVTLERQNGLFTETWEAPLPAVCTVMQGMNAPRNAILKNKLAANRATIPHLTVADIGLEAGHAGQAGSPSAVLAAFVPQRENKGVTITDAPGLVQALFAQKVLG